MLDEELFNLLLEINNYAIQHDTMLMACDEPRERKIGFCAVNKEDALFEPRIPAKWMIGIEEVRDLTQDVKHLMHSVSARQKLIRKLESQKFSLQELHQLVAYDLQLAIIDEEWVILFREQTYNAREKKARQLLLRFLNKEQRLCLLLNKHFIVEGTERRYRLGSQSAILNIDNKPTHTFCIHPKMGGLPHSDHLLAIKLLLDADEEKFWEIAHFQEIA